MSLRIDAEAGDAGEVLVNGPNVMQGYWNKPDQTAAALEDGWYRTGDIGYLDDEGYLYLVDRAKDMIISGGENVYCSEVEELPKSGPGKVLKRELRAPFWEGRDRSIN